MIFKYQGHTYDVREHFYGRCAYVDDSPTPQDLSDAEYKRISTKGKNMKTYQIKKENARQLAIDWQFECGERNVSYSELEYMTKYFERLGRRFGLLHEFRENAII